MMEENRRCAYEECVMCVLGFTKPAFIYAVSNSQSHVGVQSRHGRVYTRPCKSIINLATGTSRYLSTQENPLMYTDVYFRILHAYTIIFSIYLNIGFPITPQKITLVN